MLGVDFGLRFGFGLEFRFKVKLLLTVYDLGLEFWF